LVLYMTNLKCLWNNQLKFLVQEFKGREAGWRSDRGIIYAENKIHNTEW
jgi:hypothetical protein